MDESDDDPDGALLIEELVSNPPLYHGDDEHSNSLLTAYWRGLPIETLRPLLRSSHPNVRSVAIFVASELDERVRAVLDDVWPLLSDPEPYIQVWALEAIAMGGDGDGEVHARIAGALDSSILPVRILAMNLLSTANERSLAAARKVMATVASAAASRWIVPAGQAGTVKKTLRQYTRDGLAVAPSHVRWMLPIGASSNASRASSVGRKEVLCCETDWKHTESPYGGAAQTCNRRCSSVVQ